MKKEEIVEKLTDLMAEIDAIDLRGHRAGSAVQVAIGDAWEGLDSALDRLTEEVDA